MNRPDPVAAFEALNRAQATITEAEQARDGAAAELDRQLAAVGWKRVGGAFTATATPVYTFGLYGGGPVPIGDVIAQLQLEAAR